MRYVPGLVAALVLIFALDSIAQSVAEIARKERERQRTVQSRIVVTGGRTAAAAPETPQTTPGAPPAAAATTSAGPGGLTDNAVRDESYWRAAFQQARDDAKRAEERVQLLDLRLKELNTQLLRQSDVYNRENRILPEIAVAQKELEEARVEAGQAKQRIVDLEEELRKSGGLPGWAR